MNTSRLENGDISGKWRHFQTQGIVDCLYNPGDNILEHYNVLVQLRRATSKTKPEI